MQVEGLGGLLQSWRRLKVYQQGLQPLLNIRHLRQRRLMGYVKARLQP